MTVDVLNNLPTGTLLYVPVGDEVLIWEFAGQVPNRSWYTLIHPPDQDGSINNRRPSYVSALDLLHATLNETSAWQYVHDELLQRIHWIQKRKLNNERTTETI